MVDLTTRYLGLRLRNPLMAGAGPLNGELDNIRRLEDLGAALSCCPRSSRSRSSRSNSSSTI